MIFIGTESGLWTLRGDTLEPVANLAARDVTALAHDGTRTWAIVDGRSLWSRRSGHDWEQRASIDGPAATCLAPIANGLLIGTEHAHLLRFANGKVAPIEAFDSVEGRKEWYTPWGDPADVRSMSVAADGTIHVNVHVGGVVRSRDGGTTWTPTVDIEADVHQVLAHPVRAGIVLAAAYEGFGISRDGGESWEFITDGMHAHYSRVVAVAGDTVLVSASTGPRGRRAALYRKALDGAAKFERCGDRTKDAALALSRRLPWFDDNIDTGCVAAADSLVIFGTEDGRIFRSNDFGEHWELVTKGLPAIRCVLHAG